MNDFESAAQAMFGNMATSKPNVEAMPSDPREQQMAERLFGDSMRNPPSTPNTRDRRSFDELTEADKGARLFAGTDPTLTFADATQAIFNAGLEHHLHDRDTAQEIAAEWAQTFADHELTGSEAKILADVGAQVMRSPPTPELVSQWRESAISNLKSTYGIQGAGQALEDARSYIAMRGEGLAEMLDALGLASHPAVVTAAAARGRQLRLSGRLR